MQFINTKQRVGLLVEYICNNHYCWSGPSGASATDSKDGQILISGPVQVYQICKLVIAIGVHLTDMTAGQAQLL